MCGSKTRPSCGEEDGVYRVNDIVRTCGQAHGQHAGAGSFINTTTPACSTIPRLDLRAGGQDFSAGYNNFRAASGREEEIQWAENSPETAI